MSYYEIEHQGGIAILRMAKAPANAIDPAFLDDLHEALRELAADPPNALILTGDGRFFSGGLDLEVVPALDADGQRRMLDRINGLGPQLFGFPRPVVSAINGHAVGAGFGLALAGDHRVASREASYGLTEMKVGMPYPAGAFAVIQAELPAPSARRLVLGAELVNAETVLALGAFDEIVPPGEVLLRALDVAARLATYPSEVFTRSKLALRASLLASFERILKEGDPLNGAWMVDESADAARATLGGDAR